jgi:nucleoid-associated protein YgaU
MRQADSENTEKTGRKIMLKDLFKLEKLKIKAYRTAQRSTSGLIGSFEAMFNPESFSRNLGIVYGKNQGMNTSSQSLNYSKTEPEEFTIKLVLDGTGVNETGAINLLGNTETVSDRVEKLLNLTFKMNGDIHEPNYLKIKWGELNLDCRLKNININYTSFDRNGHALRADIDLTLLSDEDPKKRLHRENKRSPDVTHSRIVMAGDTLPLLSQQIYGSSAHYLQVAQFNQLDDFRNLTPGQRLYFPPITQDSTVQ